MQRRFFLHAGVTLAACAVTAVAGLKAAQAQSRPSAGFPVRPIRLVIAFPAGGPTDALVRTLAGNAADILGQPVRVDNMPGAGGSLPLEQLQLAAADGYTLAQIPVSVFRPPLPNAKSHAAAGDDLVYVINVTGYALGLVLLPDSPLMSWSGFVDWAKGYLGRLAYGPNSPPLTLDLIAEKLGQHLQQKLHESAASLSGSLVAQADSSGAPLRWSGGDDQAQPSGSSTLKDLGLDLIQNEPFSIGAPRGTPPAVVKRLHDAFKKAMTQQNFKRSLAQHDMTPLYLDRIA